MAIPTGRPRDHYEVPLWMYKIVRDVLDDAKYYPLGLEVIREEILVRLSETQDCPFKSDFISVQFLTDLRSSLNHPQDCRRPWPYYRANDESSSEESLSDDSLPDPATAQQSQNETVWETKQHQEASDDEADDSASAVSMTSFHSAQETTTLNEPGTAPVLSSHAVDVPNFVASSDSEGEVRRLDFLQAFFQFLEVQLEHLKLVSESRKRRKARERARGKTGRTAQEHEEMPGVGKDNEESSTQQAEAAENPQLTNTALKTAKDRRMNWTTS